MEVNPKQETLIPSLEVELDKSTKKEEASFLSAHSYYLAIPRSSLDQSDTKTAIDSFQRFIDAYPTSEKITEANKYVQEMQLRLENQSL